jgi:hypothetical protein
VIQLYLSTTIGEVERVLHEAGYVLYHQSHQDIWEKSNGIHLPYESHHEIDMHKGAQLQPRIRFNPMAVITFSDGVSGREVEGIARLLEREQYFAAVISGNRVHSYTRQDEGTLGQPARATSKAHSK